MTVDNAPFVEFHDDPPITVGTLNGSRMLEGAEVSEFGSCVLDYVKEHAPINLLLNFEHVTYLASASLSELIVTNDAVVAGGGSLRLCGLSDRILQVFEIANFTKILAIDAGETAPHAAARFKRAIAIETEQDAWEDRHK